VLEWYYIDWRRQPWGTGARAPFNFQLFNFWGQFKVAQTLTFDFKRLPIQ